ncbi:MAG: BON domain-containing protein [Pseudohongiellaceae bacterium]
MKLENFTLSSYSRTLALCGRGLLVVVLSLAVLSCKTVAGTIAGEGGITENPSRRTTGTIVEDEALETKIGVNLDSWEPALKDANIDVLSHNGVVLLVGQVPTQELKDRATEIAAETSRKIKRIHNELEIGESISFGKQTSDTWVNTKIRTQFYANNEVPSGQVRHVVENGVAYLFGIVTIEQGERAASVTRNVSGVNRVVKLFEYIN